MAQIKSNWTKKQRARLLTIIDICTSLLNAGDYAAINEVSLRTYYEHAEDLRKAIKDMVGKAEKGAK